MILLIDKPTGISSFDVIRILRRTKIEPGGKKIKMGHAGTLDPLASGLMIIATEADTKRIEEFMGLPKEYECELEFGKRSISGDADGEMSEGNLRDISREEFEEVLQRFIGTIEQRPPQTSAVKIGGKRAYKLAREGKI
ncbi:tRNA pseudouridine(55) synthase, partial [Candidatus Peregrinibacteria bacterium CG11_big_fil_rev_8_21_14_0_20_46_8]